jgi:tetratricopeptide (TPR) repeat protein
MTMSISASPSGPNWSRLWQIPTLLLGLAVFAYGSYMLYRSVAKRAVPFETHLGDVRQMLSRKDFDGAIRQINTLANHFTSPLQQAQLEALTGDAYYLAPADPSNFKGAIEHYQKAQNLGWPKKGMTREQTQIDERWGLCAAGSGDYVTAVERLEKALAADPSLLQADGHTLLDACQKVPKPDVGKALVLLEKIGTKPNDVDDQVWALTKRIELLAGQPGLTKAIADGRGALAAIKERDPEGRLLTALGRAEFETGQVAQAEQDMLAARKLFVSHNLDDGRAALVLGKICQARNEYDRAKDLYQDVITSHAGSSIFAAGRFGRAEIAAYQKTPNEMMDDDYHFAINEVLATTVPATGTTSAAATQPSIPKAPPAAGSPNGRPEMLGLDAIRSALNTHTTQYQEAGNLDGALHFIELTRELHEPDTAEMTFREATIHERRADQIAGELAALPQGPARQQKYQEMLGHYAAAAECYWKHSSLSIMQRDVSLGSLWKAASLFDKAGLTGRSISTYQEFIKAYPSDAMTPEATLNVGQLYQSLGQFDKAIPYFQKNLEEHPNTTPAYQSSVQLGRCYVAMGEKFYPQAEQALLGVVQDNRTLQPSAAEFRASVFTLGELYYRSGRWSDAILRLEEAITRYPEDSAINRTRFRLADSYRKSAAEIADAIAKDPKITQRDILEQARKDRLQRAGAIFSQLISTMDDPNKEMQTLTPTEMDLLRFSYLYRADCSFDLADYPNAIKQYDAAASRFAQSITAVEAYVQIVNAYLAMNQPAQAAAAAERARLILQRIPDAAFGKSPLALSRNYYEDVFRIAKP